MGIIQAERTKKAYCRYRLFYTNSPLTFREEVIAIFKEGYDL